MSHRSILPRFESQECGAGSKRSGGGPGVALDDREHVAGAVADDHEATSKRRVHTASRREAFAIQGFAGSLQAAVQPTTSTLASRYAAVSGPLTAFGSR